MRTLLVLCLSAYGLAACGDPAVRITKREETTREGEPVRVIDTLNCPEHQGDLTRTQVSADGLSCIYTGPRGAEVTLQLVRLADGQTPEQAIAPFEDSVRALMPATVARASDGALVTVQAGDGGTRVRLPGFSVEADDTSSSVNIGGFVIRGDGNEGHSDVNEGEQVSVNANDDAAEVRAITSGDIFRATYVLSDAEPSEDGWRLAGYEARGPGAGPIVIAVVHSKDRNEDVVFDAAKDLVTLNVGGSL